MRLLIVGDAHGDWNTVNGLLAKAQAQHNVSAAIQVGDLGLDKRALVAFAKTGGRFALPMHVIDGNHDDHAFLARAHRRGQTAEWAQKHNLLFQPRPSTAVFAGAVVGFLGGALHVVRPQQHGLLSGASNYVRQREAVAAAELFDREKPALIVTHSCPGGIGIGMHGHPELGAGLHEHVVSAGFDPGPDGDRGEAALRLLWERLRHRPPLWVYGHFHTPWRARIGQTCFVSVPAIFASPASEVLLWDSESGELCGEVLK